MKRPWKAQNSLEFRSCLGGELFKNCLNPGRGWYHIYTFALAEWEKESLAWLPMMEEESLALLLIDIGDYRGKAISKEGLAYLEKILTFFEKAEKDVILRIVYDTKGKGMEKEPMFLEQIGTHMKQVGRVVASHSEAVLLCQGLFVGNWGEMHGSKFLGKKTIRSLTECWENATEGKVKLAFRKPVFCRLAQENITDKENRIGFFDDAIFASPTHMGTFSEESAEGYDHPWSMGQELKFLEPVMEIVPCGGEAVSGEKLPSPQEVEQELSALHATYLNSVHEERLLRDWKEKSVHQTEEKKWSSLYEYVGAHLGYRFLIKKVQKAGIGRRELEIQLENTGFASLTEPAEFYLKLEYDAGETAALPINYELSSLKSREQTKFRVPVPDSLWRPGRVYLAAWRKRGKRPIQFANAEERELLLGEIR